MRTKNDATRYLGLWAVLGEVKEHLPSLSPSETRTTVLSVVRDAIERQIVAPGEFVEERFVLWDLAPNEAMERIESTWPAPEKEPGISDRVWFVQRARTN